MGSSSFRFDEALEAVNSIRSPDDELGILLHIRDLYQIANIGYYAFRIGTRIGNDLPIRATCDPAWLDHYMNAELFLIDPVLRLATNEDLPIDWKDVDRTAASARQYFDEVARYEVGTHGMGIPIHSLEGEAIFTFTSHFEDADDWGRLQRAVKSDLALIARHYHRNVVAFARSQFAQVRLSRQEHACLALIADGHTAATIGVMLGLSVHTVRMHLRKAKERLGVKSRSEAVFLATRLGLIQPSRAQ